MDEDIKTAFDSLQKHMDTRFDEIHRILLQLQSDLRTFYRELGYHDTRLDNLEGKQ